MTQKKGKHKDKNYPSFFDAYVSAVCNQFGRESNRGFVILGVAYIESMLQIHISKAFQSSKVADYILGQLNLLKKIELALKCGIITPKLQKDLDNIRLVRNSFAHLDMKNPFKETNPWKRKKVRKMVRDIVDNYIKVIEEFVRIKSIYCADRDDLISNFKMVLAMIIYYLNYLNVFRSKGREATQSEPFYSENFISILWENEAAIRDGLRTLEYKKN